MVLREQKNKETHRELGLGETNIPPVHSTQQIRTQKTNTWI